MDKAMNIGEKIINMFLDREGNVDISSVLGTIAFGFFMYFSYHQFIVLGKDFSPMQFGAGLGSLLGAIGLHKYASNKGDYGV